MNFSPKRTGPADALIVLGPWTRKLDAIVVTSAKPEGSRDSAWNFMNVQGTCKRVVMTSNEFCLLPHIYARRLFDSEGIRFVLDVENNIALKSRKPKGATRLILIL